MNIIYSISFALCAGLLPSLLWLWFWRHEDNAHPEPRTLIALAFIGGMLGVFIALVLEKISVLLIPAHSPYYLVLAWAAIEELVKYFIASLLVLNRRENDEPIDNVIYLISVALGFAALENTLFILGPILQHSFNTGFNTANLRFIGSTLLHTISSSSIGIALAFSFGKSAVVRRHALWIGMFIAITLHTLFNLFIIQGSGSGVLIIFSVVWLAIVILILLFEKIKRLSRINN